MKYNINAIPYINLESPHTFVMTVRQNTGNMAQQCTDGVLTDERCDILDLNMDQAFFMTESHKFRIFVS